MKMKTIKRTDLGPIKLKHVPNRVIDNGYVFNYVGIGWVNEGPASSDDKMKYPVVIE